MKTIIMLTLLVLASMDMDKRWWMYGSLDGITRVRSTHDTEEQCWRGGRKFKRRWRHHHVHFTCLDSWADDNG